MIWACITASGRGQLANQNKIFRVMLENLKPIEIIWNDLKWVNGSLIFTLY